MTPLALRLLGPPQIELNGEPLEIKRRKALALLIYLGVSGDPQPRDRLAALLWPESSQQNARKALRRDLSELNLALGGEWLDVDRESVGLRAGFWLDVTEFQQHLAAETADPDRFIKAAELYRDDFLTGFTLPNCPDFDEWQFFHSESLRQALASTLEKLAISLENQADYEPAIDYARRWLALDPLHEPAHRQLMRLYAQAGQQAAALRQYQLCLETLEAEFGAPPAQETTALYEQIRAGQPIPAGLINRRYEILEEIGRGGFAIVHRAQDTELDRLVALKELRPTMLQDADWVRRFKREARTLAGLDHHRIVTVYDVVELEGRLFIVMRLVDGASLAEVIAAQNGGLPWSQTLDIFSALAEGLDFAHQQDILHRDLKPANVLMDPVRGPLLTDFGLAKLESDGSTSITASGGVIGSPHYIAPEVWEGQGSSRQSDLYALGCILFEMLTGRKPFPGDSPPAVMAAHFNPLALPDEWSDDVPAGVAEVLQKALAKQPRERYRSASEMALALKQLDDAKAEPDSPPIVNRQAKIVNKQPVAHNLPPQTTSFIGRERELADIERLLVGEAGCRLLNLIGPGGTGKTRLALAAAGQILQAYPDGVYFVPLAPVGEVGDIVPAMAEALRFTFYGSADPKDQLLDYLAQKETLLVVDNFEHLLEGAPVLSEIVSRAPAVTLLATSRERLNLQEEWGYEVPGLAVPDMEDWAAGRLEDEGQGEPGAYFQHYSAVELFTQRARQISANFTPTGDDLAGIGQICHLVEGMPLALELAAPWIRTLSCGEIAAEIEHSLDFLTTTLRNVPERHRSLRVVFEQTWERLSAAEQDVLRQLSVFRGGCTREAAEQVTGATLPVLSSLVDKALLRRANTGRYEIHELIRQFAEIQLEADPEAMARKRHRDYFVAFLEARTAGVKGGRQKDTVAEIKADMDNVRLVWRQAAANRDAEVFERAAECLFVFYLYSSGHYEGQITFQQAAAAFIEGLESQLTNALTDNLVVLDQQENLAAFLLAGQGYFLARTRDPFTGQPLLERALALLPRSNTSDRHKEGFVWLWLGWVFLLQGQSVKALEYVEPTLAILTETGDRWAEGWSLLLWANAVSHVRPLEADDVYQRGLAVCRASSDLNNLGYTSQMRSGVNMELGRYAQAKRYINEAIRVFEEVGNVLGLGYALQRRGQLAIAQGEYRQAIQSLQQSIANFEEVRTEHNVAWTQIELGKAFRLQGDYEQAEQLYRQSLEVASAANNKPTIALYLLNLGCLIQDQGDLPQAEQLQRESLTIWQQTGEEARVGDISRCLGHLMVALGESRHDEARQHFREALKLSIKIHLVPIALDVCRGVAQLLTQAGETERAVELATLAEQHEASTFETKEKARQLLAELEDQLPPATVRTARAKGQALDWQETAKRLIDELQEAEPTTDDISPRLERPRHNLPTQTTSFVGREEELADIRRLLLEEAACRLVTLIGPGGTGKTRLALTAAGQLLDAFSDGVYFVSLAPVSEVADIVPAIAEALRFTFYGSADPKDQLLNYLSRKQMLIVVDNFEHLLEGAELLADILAEAPDITLLATSREWLHLQEEWGYEVQGLRFPADFTGDQTEGGPALEAYSGVQLFLQRARRALASFTPSAEDMADIVRICQLVEGMPLALELAAPWIRTLSCHEIATEIERSLDFLTTTLRNMPERHRSLRAVFEQTWGRLPAAQQDVLRQLSVFRGGCTREAAEQVTGASLLVLSSLVDKALLRRTNLGRYELHELIRQFAETQLASDPNGVEQIQQRHRDYFVAYLERRTAGVKGHGQKATLAEIKADIENVRLTWRRAVVNRDTEAIERVAECLYVYYLYSSGHYEGRMAFQQAIDAFSENADILFDENTEGEAQPELVVLEQQEPLVGFLLAGQSHYLTHTLDPRVGQHVGEQALRLLRRSKPIDRRKEAFALAFLSWTLNYQGRSSEAIPYAELGMTLAAEAGDYFSEWWSLIALGSPTAFIRPGEAKSLLKRALALCEKSGDVSASGYTYQNLAGMATRLGRYAEAQHYIDQAIRIFEEFENRLGLGYAFARQGDLFNFLGEYERAAKALQQSASSFDEVKSIGHANSDRIELAEALRLQGDDRQAEILYRQLLHYWTDKNYPERIGQCRVGLGHLAYHRADFPQAERLYRQAMRLFRDPKQEARLANVAVQLGQVLVASGADRGDTRRDEARQYLREALELSTTYEMAPVALDVCLGVAHLLAQTNEMERAVELATLAEQHEASTFETKEKARQLLTELEDQLPSDAAQATQDLWITVQELLAELAGDEGRRGSEAG